MGSLTPHPHGIAGFNLIKRLIIMRCANSSLQREILDANAPCASGKEGSARRFYACKKPARKSSPRWPSDREYVAHSLLEDSGLNPLYDHKTLRPDGARHGPMHCPPWALPLGKRVPIRRCGRRRQRTDPTALLEGPAAHCALRKMGCVGAAQKASQLLPATIRELKNYPGAL